MTTCARPDTLVVDSPNVSYGEEFITSKYAYETSSVAVDGNKVTVRPETMDLGFRTTRAVPKTGVMIVGLGGNNGSTFVAGLLANREGITWRTAKGVKTPNYYGSITQASTLKLGVDAKGQDVFVPLTSVVPMVNPNDLVVSGWDISSMDLAGAMERAGVLDYDLQRQLVPYMKDMKPLPSIYFPDFISANQKDRADNVLTGSKQEQLEQVRAHMRAFKAENKLDKVLILWSANTERYSDIAAGLNDTAENLLASIAKGEAEVSPSTVFAVAAILEGNAFINGSPQNTFVPGVVELAAQKGVFIGGDDFKSGQTKLKSVLVDFFVSAGIKPVSIASYNHLGNNDGKNLSSAKQFRSKEISKSGVVDDMVNSNSILYKEGEHPDHTIVIKYMPYVGDSKRALDEYISEIFMGGINTISIHNTCEDSLLAVPLMFDLVIITELMQRVEYSLDGAEFDRSHCVLSILSYLLKAPMVPEGTPVVNALARQKNAIENLLRALVGLRPESGMSLEHKLPQLMRQ